MKINSYDFDIMRMMLQEAAKELQGREWWITKNEKYGGKQPYEIIYEASHLLAENRKQLIN